MEHTGGHSYLVTKLGATVQCTVTTVSAKTTFGVRLSSGDTEGDFNVTIVR